MSNKSTSPAASRVDPRFEKVVLGAAISTFLMIVIGAITRVSESGMGCGTYWPSCNGRLIPEFVDTATAIEFGHRLFALLVGLFALGVLIMAWRRYRNVPRIFYPAALGMALYVVQSGLGAATVALSNQWVSVLLHLGNSMFLLACYLVTWVNLRSLNPDSSLLSPDSTLPFVEVAITTIMAFTVSLVGAAVAGNNATKACVGWPLCAGQVWPAEQGPLQLLNMLHRLVAGGLGILLVWLIVEALRRNVNSTMRRALFIALGAYLLQATLGAFVVMVNNREWLVVSQSLHVTFAAATWAAMIIASSISWLQQLPSPIKADRDRKVTTPSAITSN